MAQGSLFQVASDSSVVTVDGQNIVGKYKLLHKTANFFSNQFTWLIVITCIIAFAVVVRIVRNYMKKKQDYKLIRTNLNDTSNKKIEN